jgi:hypothetical protein
MRLVEESFARGTSDGVARAFDIKPPDVLLIFGRRETALASPHTDEGRFSSVHGRVRV